MRSKKTHVAAFALLALLALLPAAPVSGAQKLKQKAKKEKRFEPVVKPRVADYAGRYVGIAPDYYLEITADSDGDLAVTSHEGGRRATLRDVRVEGARLTGKRVYANGATKDFEATFSNRILNGEISFGVVVENVNAEFEGMTFTRLFYRFDPAP